MNRPKPRGEIVVSQNRVVLFIDILGADALAWIKEEAPNFGALLEQQPGSFVLLLNMLYDQTEVATFLASGGDI